MLIEESQKKADAAAQGPRSTTVEEDSPPEDLLCPICKQVYRDAVMTPCCLNNFCDECKIELINFFPQEKIKNINAFLFKVFAMR